jgi:hypothetical protein
MTINKSLKGKQQQRSTENGVKGMEIHGEMRNVTSPLLRKLSHSEFLRPFSMKHSTIEASIDSEMEIPFYFMATDILLNCLFIYTLETKIELVQ